MKTRLNRWVFGFGAALAIALLALSMFSGSAGAETIKNGSIKVTQHEYVQICQSLGGTSSRAGYKQVTCDMGGGYSSTCNFKTNTCTDTIPDRVNTSGGRPWLGGNVTVSGAIAAAAGSPAQPATVKLIPAKTAGNQP